MNKEPCVYLADHNGECELQGSPVCDTDNCIILTLHMIDKHIDNTLNKLNQGVIPQEVQQEVTHE